MNLKSKYLSAAERRAMTVQAVLKLAAVRNPSEITTAAISTDMGLSQAALFRHFSTKDEVWQAVMEWVATELMARVEHAAKDGASSIEALEGVFAAHVAFAAEHPGVPRILFSELQRTESTPAKVVLEATLQRYGQMLVGLLEQGKQSGEVEEEIDSPIAAALLVGAVQGLIIKAMLGGDMAIISRDAPRTFALFQRGIRRRN